MMLLVVLKLRGATWLNLFFATEKFSRASPTHSMIFSSLNSYISINASAGKSNLVKSVSTEFLHLASASNSCTMGRSFAASDVDTHVIPDEQPNKKVA